MPLLLEQALRGVFVPGAMLATGPLGSRLNPLPLVLVRTTVVMLPLAAALAIAVHLSPGGSY